MEPENIILSKKTNKHKKDQTEKEKHSKLSLTFRTQETKQTSVHGKTETD